MWPEEGQALDRFTSGVCQVEYSNYFVNYGSLPALKRELMEEKGVRFIYYFIVLGGTNATMVQYRRYSFMWLTFDFKCYC